MFLFRDVMDKQIVDRYGFKAGKVDDILLELSEGERPVVRGIITGYGSLTRLLGTPVERLVTWLGHHLLGLPGDVNPVILDWEKVMAIDIVVHVDIDREDAHLMESKDILWKRWVRRLPFSER